MLFTIATKKKYPGINLKELKVLYAENYKKLKKTQRNGKIFHAHGLEKLKLLSCPYYLKQFIF